MILRITIESEREWVADRVIAVLPLFHREILHPAGAQGGPACQGI